MAILSRSFDDSAENYTPREAGYLCGIRGTSQIWKIRLLIRKMVVRERGRRQRDEEELERGRRFSVNRLGETEQRNM